VNVARDGAGQCTNAFVHCCTAAELEKYTQQQPNNTMALRSQGAFRFAFVVDHPADSDCILC
jgi:hypothetical protein